MVKKFNFLVLSSYILHNFLILFFIFLFFKFSFFFLLSSSYYYFCSHSYSYSYSSPFIWSSPDRATWTHLCTCVPPLYILYSFISPSFILLLSSSSSFPSYSDNLHLHFCFSSPFSSSILFLLFLNFIVTIHHHQSSSSFLFSSRSSSFLSSSSPRTQLIILSRVLSTYLLSSFSSLPHPSLHPFHTFPSASSSFLSLLFPIPRSIFHIFVTFVFLLSLLTVSFNYSSYS